MGVITQFIEAMTAWLSGFTTMIITTFKSFIDLFYTSEDGLTVFGILGLMGIAVGLIYLALNFVRRMFKA